MEQRVRQENTEVVTNASSATTVVPVVEAMSNMPSCLMYVRIGKSGSSSLLKHFDDLLGEEQVSHDVCLVNFGMTGLQRFSRQTARNSTKQVYQGHCGYGFDQYVCAEPRNQSSAMSIQPQPSCFYYTWLREPVSRVISSLIYNHKKKLPLNLTTYKRCFRHDTYCQLENGPNWQNSMTYLLGSPRNEIYERNKPVNVTRKHLEKAKQRLEHDFVAFGLLEYSEESLRMLQPILNVISTKKSHDQAQQNTSSKIQQALAQKNTGVGSDSFKERVRIELGSDIEQANQLDIELYAFARQLFLDRLKRAGTTSTEIAKTTKDWNASVVQLHSCPQVVSRADALPWYMDMLDESEQRRNIP
jgi:Sulfotransferase family